jgi:hypothetical protein
VKFPTAALSKFIAQILTHLSDDSKDVRSSTHLKQALNDIHSEENDILVTLAVEDVESRWNKLSDKSDRVR